MIKSKEQFATAIMNLAMFERDASENSIYTMHIDDLIEALRNVARAARGLKRHSDTHWSSTEHGASKWEDMRYELAVAFEKALDALPAWVLEGDQ